MSSIECSVPMLLEHFGLVRESPDGVRKLRDCILGLAVRGQLTEQLATDEPSSFLLEKIENRRHELVREKTIRAKVPMKDKQLPAEALPVGWEWASLGNVTFNRDGDRIPVRRADREHQEKKYDYYGASGVIDRVDSYLFDQPLLLVGEDGANLINRSTPIAFIAEGKYWVNNHAHVLDGFSRDMLEYLRVFINSISLEPYITGMAQPKMNQARMNSIPVALPPLTEQRRIVAKVDTLMGMCDELEASLERERALRAASSRSCLIALTSPQEKQLEQSAPPAQTSKAQKNNRPQPNHPRTPDQHLRQAWQRLCDHFDVLFDVPETLVELRDSVLQLAVQGALTKPSNDVESADSLLARLKVRRCELIAAKEIRKGNYADIASDEIPFRLPLGWRWVRIGQIAERVEYGTSQKANGDEKGVPVLRMGNIQDGSVLLGNVKYVPETIDDLPDLYLEHDDLLFNRTNSWELVGKTGVFKGESNEYTFASYLIRVRVFDGVLPDFVNIAMNAPYYRSTQIEPTLTQQCGQANFNGTKMKNSLVPLAPTLEQARVTKQVASILSVIASVQSSSSQRVALADRLIRSIVS